LNSFLEAHNITKYLNGDAGSKKSIVENLSFSISEKDNITAILAPVRGGKTTILKILAGLDNDYMGDIFLKGFQIKNKLPYIPEKPASFPWLNVYDNIKIILSIQRKDEISRVRIQELINLVGLTGYENHFPANKSYGFRFRISLARALSNPSPLILLDEPWKQMDPETKGEILNLVKNLSYEGHLKFLITSSNITDVTFLSDKILLLDKFGKLSETISKSSNEPELIKNNILNIILKENIVNNTNFSI
jgi:ABC-type multidrug transport system ATPase subunit